MIRILPDIHRITAHWTHRSSEVPDYLLVPMSDGTTVRYNPQVEQPGFVKAVDTIRGWKIGYMLKKDEK